RAGGPPAGSPPRAGTGPAAARGPGVRADEIVRACGLGKLHFRGVPAHQEAFQPFIEALRSSPAVELARLRARPHERRRLRKLARELGPVRFEPDVRSLAVLETLLAWKRARAAREGAADPFAAPRIRALLPALVEEP